MDLSKETFLDYSSLASLIKNTSFLETLLLPRVRKENADEILEIINEVTIENTTLTHVGLNISQLGNNITDKNRLIYQRIQSRLERNKKRIFTIHGGGYIGLGLMADIVSQSPFDYNIFATSSDKFTNLLINSINRFWIQHGTSKEEDVTCVNNVSMVYSRDNRNIINLYVHSNVMAICLTEEGLLNSSKDIAQGLIARYEKDQAGLKIFVLMNKPDCADFVRNEITKEILKQTKSSYWSDKVLASIQFIPTMVDRIVNKIDYQTLLQQFREQLFKCKALLIEMGIINLHHDIPDQIESILLSPRKLIKMVKKLDLQFNLFNAELSFVLYVPDGLPEVSRFPAIKAVKNLDQFIMLKNKYVNGPHAILAWIGGLMGYRTIAAAIKNPMILNLIKNMMKYEIGPILQVENPSISKKELDFLKSTFINHCRNSKKDSIVRVGRDPLRKIIRDGCIAGVIDLRNKNGLKISTRRLEFGISAGLVYAVKGIDTGNLECQKIKAIYAQSNSFKDVLCYKGPYGKGCYPGLDENQDHQLIQNILYHATILEGLINENNDKHSSRWRSTRTRSTI